MATLDWPAERAFGARGFSWGATTPKSGFGSFFTGETQTISHLADRLRATVTLAKCEPIDAARREAFFMEVISAGHLVRVGHMHRMAPNGTLRGAPTVAASAAAGARQLQVQTVAGRTLQGGDVLGAAGRLLLTGFAGAVADGAGLLTMPLVLPLREALAAGVALGWMSPTTTFQIPATQSSFTYGRGAWQGELEFSLVEVY